MKDHINITIDNTVLKQIDNKAKKENRSRSNMIEIILNKFFEKERK